VRKPIRERIEKRIADAPVPRSWKRAIWRKQINAKYEPHFLSMKEQNADWNDINDLNGQWFELAELEEEVEVELTESLIRKAEKYRLAVPPHVEDNGMWEVSSFSHQSVLSDAAIRKLRDEIRAEEKWRRESRVHWITILTACSGVIGTATGLVALLMKGSGK
jgi:hypothetical protein